VAAVSTRAAHDAVRVIFLGPPGAGKGTQAARLAAHLGVPKISTGEMLRTAIAKKTPLGREAGPLMEKGHLVPDELLLKLVGERTSESDCQLGYAFIVFDFEVPRAVLLERLSGRRWCPSCQATYHVVNDPPRQPMVCDHCGTKLVQRDDDLEAVVAERLREYDERTFPLVEYYRARTRMVKVDGDRLQDHVFQDLLQAVEVRA